MTTDAIQVELSEGAACAGALLVGADGVASRIRALAGIASEHQALDDLALTAVLKTTEPHRDHAWQRFWPDGPLALLPLGGAYTRSLIWSAPAATVQKLLALPEPAFEEELARRAPAFGDFHLCSPRQTFPLGLGQAHRYIGTRVALVGDAAHQMHPLAGQGMNLGLEDAAALAATLADRRYGMDPGDHRRLRHYERWRKAANTPMLQGVEWLRRLFGARHPALVAVRTFGLHLTEHQPWLKRQLIYQAAGLHEDRPETGRSSSAARGGPLKPY
ncbi:MAG TPA: FAD-dependent monooxygenase, partial [Acidiferrobacteraceae bacterium]|nr:FAD-dependent monooxygenase [Acidiferrobacteraceae bacterium]